MILKSDRGPAGKASGLLLVSPIAAGNIEDSEFKWMFGKESVYKAARFTRLYAQLAESLDCGFLN